MIIIDEVNVRKGPIQRSALSKNNYNLEADCNYMLKSVSNFQSVMNAAYTQMQTHLNTTHAVTCIYYEYA